MADTSPDERIAGVPIARLLRNLEETSYNEGAIDLACRLTDCKAVIEELLAARATPPSPSTAPEVAELPAPPTLPRYLLDMIGEYGMARTDSLGQLEVQHRWEILIGGIKRYASEYGRALASRPAEVDDEGLPPLPPEAARATKGAGAFFVKWQEAGKDLRGALLLYTAEQYRQGQRDAVAADRARRVT